MASCLDIEVLYILCIRQSQSYNKNNRITKTVMKQTPQGNQYLTFFFSYILKVPPWLETKSLMTLMTNFEIQRTTATFSSRGFAKYNSLFPSRCEANPLKVCNKKSELGTFPLSCWSKYIMLVSSEEHEIKMCCRTAKI